MSWSEILAISSFAVAAIALLLKFSDRSKKHQEQIREEWREADSEISKLLSEMSDEFTEMHAEIEVMKKQLEVFWRGVAYNSASLLHSPHTPELDVLIEKFTTGVISPEELLKFREHLLFIASSTLEGNVRNYLARQVLLVLSIAPEIQMVPIPYLIEYEIWKIKQRGAGS
jgi:hypothetical protein